MIQTSEQIAALCEALAKASAGFAPIKKNKTANVPMKAGGQYSYKYADLADVFDAVRPALAANGLAIVQGAEPHQFGIEVGTRLCHASGQWMQTSSVVPVAKDDAQGIGSATTYGRRYGLTALLGVVADDDDDGHAAVQAKPERRTESRQEVQPEPQKLDADGHDQSWALDRVKFCSALTSILGLKYEDVADYARDTKRPKPSAMTVADRQALFAELDSVAGEKRWKDWLDRKAKQKLVETPKPVPPDAFSGSGEGGDIPF